MSKCRDLMTDYRLVCLPSDPVRKVAQLLRDKEEGPAIIIEDAQTRKFVGIVTDRDLAMKVVAVGRDPESTTVEDVMTRLHNVVRADDHVQKAHDMMIELEILRIPVVDHSNRFLGIIAKTDVAMHIDQPQQSPLIVKGMLLARNTDLSNPKR